MDLQPPLTGLEYPTLDGLIQLVKQHAGPQGYAVCKKRNKPTLQYEVSLHHALCEALPHEQEDRREQEAIPRARGGSRLAITASQVAQQEADNFADALFNSIST